MLCFVFTKGDPFGTVKAEATVHFPIARYVSHDEQARQHMVRYLRENPSHSDQQVTKQLSKYQACIEAIVKRPLVRGRGIQLGSASKGRERKVRW
jgi:hypothetical protein